MVSSFPFLQSPDLNLPAMYSKASHRLIMGIDPDAQFGNLLSRYRAYLWISKLDKVFGVYATDQATATVTNRRSFIIIMLLHQSVVPW